MFKAIVLIFLKLSYLGKYLITLMLGLIDDIIRFFDEIGFVIINSFRSIRFEEIRDFIVNNYLTILLFIILIILLYSTIKKENKYEEN